MKQKKSIILGGRPFTATVIAKNWKKICRHNGGLFVTSAGILDAMHELGISYTLHETKLKKANSIGDLLGTKHFNLPSSGTGKRAYYLPAIEMDEEELEKFAALEPEEMLAQIAEVTAMLLSNQDEVERSDPCNDLAA